MQDEYVKTFEKIQLDDDRKMEMRKALIMEMAPEKESAGKTSAFMTQATEMSASQGQNRARKTRLGTGAKVGIAAAAIAVTLGGLMAFPATRNVIASSIRNLVKLVVPEGAVDIVDQEKNNRDERVIPTDDMPESEAQAVLTAVSEQDREQDEYFESVIVSADYYSDPELNELANYYSQQGYSLLDLSKDAMFLDYEQAFDTEDWFSEGFFLTFQIGENESPSFGTIMVFKADEDQLQGFLRNKLSMINYEREQHGQETVSFSEFWTMITDEEDNNIYTGSWTGPEPEMKLLPSDSARFMDFKVTYDPETQVAVCYIEEGGGIG